MNVYRNGLIRPAGTVATPLVADLDAGANKVTDLGAPSNPTDAARHGDVAHLTGNETIAGVKTFSSAFKVATYTVATLPAATVRQVAFASDALKVGQTTGNGTGTLVYADGTAWRRCGDDVTASA